MIRAAWGVARLDVLTWLRSPAAILASLVPALGLGALVLVLSATIGMQPVALVQEGTGPTADAMGHLLESDAEAYLLTRMGRDDAAAALWNQRAAAVVIIPEDFEARIARSNAEIDLVLNNVVDVDLADDVRRSITRSLAELDAPQLGYMGERHAGGHVLSNPFRVALTEELLRETDTGFLAYQMVPILILIVLSVGVLGTGMRVARDFERGAAKVLATSPASRGAIVLGKVLGGLATTLAIVVPLTVGACVSGVLAIPRGHVGAVALVLLLVALLAVGIGIAVGMAVRRTRLAAMVGLNLAAYLFFLGGGFCTVAFLPPWVRAVTRAVPTSYAIRALRQALFYPDLQGFAHDAGLVAVFAACAAALGMVALARSWRRA